MEKKNFEELVGEQLSSVTFVQDYLQLDFDGNVLTLYVWPTIKSHNAQSKFEDVNYRNEICSFIAKLVESIIYLENEQLQITFEGNSIIQIPLSDTNPEIRSPEILTYSNRNQEWFII